MSAARARRIAAALAAALALAVPAAAAACPRTTLADVEDEVMCPVCGTSLGTSGDAPLAVQQRRLIVGLIERCRTKAQIKDALAAEYGDEVLAVPKQEGFGLATYAVPAAGFALAAGGIVLAALRWRRRGPRGTATPTETPGPGGPDPRETERLDADLKRYDL